MQFSFDLVVYLLGLAAMAGAILTRLSALEKKVDRHNNLIERIRRITGYLVGTTERWNSAKQAEVKDRVKHGLDTQMTKL